MQVIVSVVITAAVVASAAVQSCKGATETDDGNVASPDFTRYLRYAEVQSYLRGLAAARPKLVTLSSIGKTVEGRDMDLVCVSETGCKSKRAVWIDATIHAREWITTPVALYLIDMLATNASVRGSMLDGLDWYILPVANPDGYEYSHTTDRLWRKNRRQGEPCDGVDLERNFDYHWGGEGSSTNSCELIYAGKKAFSEPESANIRDCILTANRDHKFKIYVTLHSPEQAFLYPWGYATGVAAAPDKAQLVTIAEAAYNAIRKAGSVKFTIENIAASYAAAGNSVDWAKGVAGIEKSYFFELQAQPGGDGDNTRFLIPANKINGIVQQMFPAFEVFAKYAKTL